MSDEKLREVSGRARAEGRRDRDVRDRFDAALTDSSRLDCRLGKKDGERDVGSGGSLSSPLHRPLPLDVNRSDCGLARLSRA